VVHSLTDNFDWHHWQKSFRRQEIAEYMAVLSICGSNICVDYVARPYLVHPLLDEIEGQTAWWILANARNSLGGPILSQHQVRELLGLGILNTPFPQECEFKLVNFEDSGIEVKHKALHEEILVIAENARRCWRPCRHQLFHHGFRELVRLMHMIAYRLAEDGGSLKLWNLKIPLEIWHIILGMVDRDSDFERFGFGGFVVPYLPSR